MHKIKKVYIAGPFFNDKQLKTIEMVKKVCEMADLYYYSPKDELLFDSKKDSPEKATECFNSNIMAMHDTDFMIAVIDDNDPGTLFEMGFYYACDKRILAYSDVVNRKVNLMLAQSCIGFANGKQQLLDSLIRIKSDNYEHKKYTGEQE